ncbi:MAG: hypothetical protein ACYSUQ_11875, partial [Planctomycetota bacterium]
SFGTFPLNATSFPLGNQDSPTLLLQAVGGDAERLFDHQPGSPSDDPGRLLPQDAAAYPIKPLSFCSIRASAPQ